MANSRTAIRRAVVGAVAGLFIGPVASCFLLRHEPPLDPKLLLESVCVGALLGAAICFSAGGRSVSVFWLYLVLIGGGIAMVPWWYSGTTHLYYPLATIYWNSLPGKNALVVLLVHALISVVLAAIASHAYKNRRTRVLEAGAESRGGRRWYQFSLGSLLPASGPSERRHLFGHERDGKSKKTESGRHGDRKGRRAGAI